MIKLAEVSRVINAPISDVFSFTSNMENYKKWFPGVISIRSCNDLPHGQVGKIYREVIELNNEEGELEIKVHSCIKDKLFLTQGNLAGILPQMTIQFSQTSSTTCEIHLLYHSREKTLLNYPEMLTSLKIDLDNRASQGLEKLKYLMELEYEQA